MLFAADYPFLNIFWTMILFFFWVAWIWVLVGIIADLFRRHDTSGFKKALWVVCLIFLPFAGVLVYLIANGQGMAQRGLERAEANQERFNASVRSAASSDGAAQQIATAKGLLDSGAITEAEFSSLKAKALA
jgi:hypothetical protein